MINRVLIRIKVIQILYSYLLVEKKFSIESQPSAPTKEKRFAYQLYLSMLLFFIEIAGRVEKGRGDYPLADTRFIKKLNVDDKIKSLKVKYLGSFDLRQVEDQMAELIKNSAVYKNYIKKRNDGIMQDDRVWKELFDTVIMRSVELNNVISRRENYTLAGVERMKALMSETFANFMMSQDSVDEAVRTLHRSMELARELYVRLLLLPVELTHLRQLELDENRHKYLKTEEDLNPNLRFVDNQLAAALAADPVLQKEAGNMSWISEEPVMMHKLLKRIVESDIYDEYMNAEESSLTADCEFWKRVFRNIIFTDEDFLETMEDKSVFWNDDLDIIGTFVIKTIKRVQDGYEGSPLLDKFKDEEDEVFGDQLISYMLKDKDTYREYINTALNTSSWDSERLAFMDVVIIETALAEILNFRKIPLTVSINEYIEIAKSYSTAKSGGFVNGLLGGIINKLKEEGKLVGKA